MVISGSGKHFIDHDVAVSSRLHFQRAGPGKNDDEHWPHWMRRPKSHTVSLHPDANAGASVRRLHRPAGQGGHTPWILRHTSTQRKQRNTHLLMSRVMPCWRFRCPGSFVPCSRQLAGEAIARERLRFLCKIP